MHLYREILNITSIRTKIINNYIQGRSILFKLDGFKIFEDSVFDIPTGSYSTNSEAYEEITSELSTVLSNHLTLGIATVKSSTKEENSCYIIKDDVSSFESNVSNLDKIMQNKLSKDIAYVGEGKLSHISWYKIDNIVEKISKSARFQGIGSLLNNHDSYLSSSVDIFLNTPNNVSRVEFLSFYKVFGDDLDNICKIKTIDIHEVNDLEAVNPIIVKDSELKSYGSNFDKTGHPYRISLNADNLLLLFAFRTNLSEWLITHSYDNVFNNTNYNKLPGRITGRVDSFAREDKTFLLNDSQRAYKYEFVKGLDNDRKYTYVSYAGLETDGIFKSYIGDTVESLKESGSLEVYSLEPFKYKNSKLKPIFDLFSDISTIISSLVNTETGENLPIQNEDYIKLQNARMCCHQTISWDSESSTPKVTSVEFITLSEMVKVFISKSSEYLVNLVLIGLYKIYLQT